MSHVAVPFDLAVWYMFNVPAFVPVAACVSAVFSMLFVAAPKSARLAVVGLLIPWIALTGEFGPLIGLPLFFLWIIGVVVAIPTILVVWAFSTAVLKRKVSTHDGLYSN